MKKIYSTLLLAVLGVSCLTGCDMGGETVKTSYTDITAASIYGRLSDFSAKPSEVNPGDTLTFKVTPSQYFEIDEITNNGVKCQRVSANADGSAIYSTVIQEGANKLKGSYAVDTTVDFVDEFKLQISDEIFEEVMSKTKQKEGKKTDLDFRRCGIEQVGAPLKWVNGEKQDNVNKNDKVFLNYVDGDTTHVETLNLGYTVKIRYLSIDTPESTSEIEEWGLSASNYSKYIYSGDEHYKETIEDTTDFEGTGVQAGMSSIILIAQDAAIHAEDLTMEDLALESTDQGTYPATTDGNQRSLAYVWYSTVDRAACADLQEFKDSFRCLNLEMVYQGFSFGVGSRESTSDYIYRMFDAAHLSAQANHRHIFSGLEDNNYYYYEEKPVQELTLEQLYKSAQKDSDIQYYPESSFRDKKTLYKITGFVSRKLATAFYIQDKAEYSADDIAAGKCYGLYVFTYSETPIAVGDEVEVIGAISSYGGTFQMQGISYHDLKIDKNRDTTIKSSGHEIVPIQLTGKQFNEKKFPQVLVEITDTVWFYDFTTTYQGVAESIAEGGSEETNKYNTAYPYYNTSNSPIIFACFGDTDNHASITGSGIRQSKDLIRFTVDQDILVTCGLETCYSYRFFVGGSYYYNEYGAEYANLDEDNEYKDFTQTRTYQRKKATRTVVISHGYESTGGNKKMSAKICSGLDIDLVNID